MTIPTGKITSVYFETDLGNFTKIADHIDNEKLVKLCGKANRQEHIGTWQKFVYQHPNSMLIRSFETEYDAAVKIIEWICNYDFEQPMYDQAITTDLINSEDFTKVVELYYSVGSLNITREYRGQQLRDDIFHYINSAPLSSNEFIMIYECCGFDQGLVVRALNSFAYALSIRHKYLYPAHQAEEIEAYCKDVGIWEDVSGRIEFQKKRMEDAAQHDWENIAEDEKKTISFKAGRVIPGPVFNDPRLSGRGRGRGGFGRGRGGFRGARGGGNGAGEAPTHSWTSW